MADRCFLVVGARFERNHKFAKPFVFQPGSQRRTQFDDPPGKLRVTRKVGRRAQAKIQNVARQNNRVERPAHGFKEVVRAGSAGGSIVDPVAVDIEIGIARPTRLVDVPAVLVCRSTVIRH